MTMSIQKICENGYPVLAYFDKKVYLKAETDTFNVDRLFSANTAKAQNSKFKFLFCPLEYGNQAQMLGNLANLKKVSC